MPSPTYREIPLTFEQGMNTQYESSLLPDGTAELLENWVPEATGGLRVREGWKKSITTGGPSPAKGLGLSAFSITRKPTYRQRSVTTGLTASNGTTTRTFTHNWPSTTLSGSLLLLKVVVSYDTPGSTYSYPQDLGGFQLLGHFFGAVSSDGTVGFYLIKEQAAPQTSTTFKLTAANTTDEMRFAIEGVELLNISQGAAKNLLPGVVAWLGWGRDDGISGFHLLGWQSDLGPIVTARYSSGVMPFENTASGTPTLGTNPGVPGGASYTIPISTSTKLGTASGTAGVAVSPSTNYVGSIWLKEGTLTFRLNILWYDSGGALISTTNGTAVLSTASLSRYSVTGTSPVNAAFAKIQLENTTTTGVAKSPNISGAQFELGTTQTNWSFGSVSSIDTFAFEYDSTTPANPFPLTSLTPSVNLSWVEAVFLGIEAASGATNSWSLYTKGGDANIDTTIGQHLVFSNAYKLQIGTSAFTDSVTTSAAPTTSTAFHANYKVNTAAIGSDIYYVAAQDNGTSFDLYYINQTDIATGSWTLIGNVPVTTGGNPVAYATGLGKLLITHPGLNEMRRWDGVGSSISTVTGAFAGTSTAFFKSRFFVAGNVSTPTRLQYSDIGSYTSWPATSYLEVGQDDGYGITDLANQESYLIVAKGNSIYTLSGSGPDSFALYRLPTGDAAPGRSICVTPSGSVVAGKTAVWSIQGSAIEAIDMNLGATYKPAGLVFTAYNDGKVQILDVSAQKVFVYTVSSGTWHVEKFTSANNQFVAMAPVDPSRTLASPVNSTDTGLAMYRDLPSLTRTRDFAPLTAQTVLRTPVMWPVGPRSTMTPRWLFLQVRQRGAELGSLTLEASYDGSSFQPVLLQNMPRSYSGPSRYRADLGTKRSVSSIQFQLTGPSAGNQFDVESGVLGFDEEEIR